MTQKRQQLVSIEKKYDDVKISYDEKSAEQHRLEELLQALSTGVSSEEGHESGYVEQLQGMLGNSFGFYKYDLKTYFGFSRCEEASEPSVNRRRAS